MPKDRVTIGDCPKCEENSLTCTYNLFDNGELVIHSWEHKCPDCGFRQTAAFRSDDEDAEPSAAGPDHCPFCHRKGNIAS